MPWLCGRLKGRAASSGARFRAWRAAFAICTACRQASAPSVRSNCGSPRPRRKSARRRSFAIAIFFEEGGAIADPTARLIRRDICPFDRVCDHLIVLDHAAARRRGGPRVVGAYRLLRQDVAEANFGFYSAGEFDIAPLIARHAGKRFLELGRSCVAQGYRNKPTLELLWRGIWTYVQHHRIDAMFGCASLEGGEPADHALALTYSARERTGEPGMERRRGRLPGRRYGDSDGRRRGPARGRSSLAAA